MAEAVREYLPRNLPVQRGPLFGRDQAVREIVALLREHGGLLTLTGPGGVGKTRLALAVAASLCPAYADGVVFVSLAPVTDPALVAAAIAQALGVREVAGQPLDETLREHLHDRALLLVLDNFEQVLAGAPLVAHLLAACPRLSVLVTSRAVLQLSGEHIVAVPPLALPDLARLPPAGELSGYDAICLFVARAQAANAGFALTEATAPVVAAICARLDGLPLALELAAARSRLLPPRALLARLERRLPLLTGGARDLPARQQTLRDTIDWSYGLLAPGEQRLFSRLAVFTGGCSLEAAEAVAHATGDPAELLDGLASLIDQSLLQREEQSGGEPRVVMLETIQEYALERLVASGEVASVQRAHAQYYLVLVEEAEQFMATAEKGTWLDRLEVEHGNLTAAVAWAIEQGEAELALRLGHALGAFWIARHRSEGCRWLDLALARGGSAPALVRARALSTAGALRGWAFNTAAEYARARAYMEEAVALCRALDARWDLSDALGTLGWVAYFQGDDRAEGFFEESLAIGRTVGHRGSIASMLEALAMLARQRCDVAQAERYLEESLALVRRADALRSLGELACTQGDVARADRLFAESLVLARDRGERWHIALVLRDQGMAARLLGEHARAIGLYEEALVLARELSNQDLTADVLYGLGLALASHGDSARAGDAFTESLALLKAIDASTAARDTAVPQGAVPQEPAAPVTTRPTATAREQPCGLTAREVEVLRLVAQGLTNAQVAERLFVTPRTVNAHLTSIYTKLGVENRAAAIRRALDLGLA